jgi:spore coat polysaccharide biosynthesis predicted glycosyltransferase SpsG
MGSSAAVIDVAIRCDGSSKVGLGHVSRCIALAQAFRDDCRVSARVLLRGDPAAVRIVSDAGIDVRRLSDESAAADAELRQLLLHERPKALVLDVREEVDSGILRDASGSGVRVVAIDDPTPKRCLADLAFYPPIPQAAEWDWSGFNGELLVGWEWVILRRDLGEPRERKPVTRAPAILVSMGGADPYDMSSTALNVLAGINPPPQVTLALGAANPRVNALRQRGVAAGYRCVATQAGFPQLMRDADLAIISFGVTSYELAALRVPALYLCISDDHARSARPFEEAGAGRVVGVQPNIDEARFKRMLEDSIGGLRQEDAWVNQVPHLLDAGGAARVARRIAKAMYA